MNSKSKSGEFWEKIIPDANLANNALKLAERDLKTAENVFNDGDYDWSFAISYNAMLQSGRALMFFEGFRPKGEYKHLAVINFLEVKFEKDFAEELLFSFNKIRKKRHTIIYEQVNLISESEAKTALRIAQKFVEKATAILRAKNQQLYK